MPRLIPIALALFSAAVVAHPGTGLVKDRTGNIYFTDLSNIWRIEPSGRRSIAIRNVHTHELALDRQGRLVGEEVKYLGGERYLHRVWRRERSGEMHAIVPWTAGFWRRYGLVENAMGTRFWVTCPKQQCTLFSKTSRAPPSAMLRLERKDGHVNWLAPGPGDSLYFSSGRDVKIASAKHVALFAENVGSQLMGMHSVDRGQTVYVASYGDRAVYRLDGRTKTLVWRSPDPWGPTGAWREDDGSLLVLEYSRTNSVRARRVRMNGRSAIL